MTDRSADFFCALCGSAVVAEGFAGSLVFQPFPNAGAILTIGYGDTIPNAEADARRKLAARPRLSDEEYVRALANQSATT